MLSGPAVIPDAITERIRRVMPTAETTRTALTRATISIADFRFAVGFGTSGSFIRGMRITLLCALRNDQRGRPQWGPCIIGLWTALYRMWPRLSWLGAGARGWVRTRLLSSSTGGRCWRGRWTWRGL